MTARLVPPGCATCQACGHALAIHGDTENVAGIVVRHQLVCVNCGRHHVLTLTLRFAPVTEEGEQSCQQTA